MRVQVLETVRAKHRVEALIGDLIHVGERSHQVGLDARIDIHPDFLPRSIAKARMESVR
jgi:hypothetical protein